MDYQTQALYGSTPNYAAIDATMLNPNAQNGGDWTTILTNGISGAVVNGINGMVTNAVQSGQLKNVAEARNLGIVPPRVGGIPVTLIFGAALLYFLVK